MSALLRCETTGNPCGTDTENPDFPCMCRPCQASRLRAETQKTLDVFAKSDAIVAEVRRRNAILAEAPPRDRGKK